MQLKEYRLSGKFLFDADRLEETLLAVKAHTKCRANALRRKPEMIWSAAEPFNN